MNANHHAATPTLSVIDPRTLAIRSVGYCRHPDSPVIDPRITRQRFDAAGRLSESWDPRLWGTALKPNLATVYGLSAQPLLTDSVDAGWQLSLLD
ncbi:RHS repeat protein, partial [Pseudomonas sp. PD9R]|nr:RHS repeat protein [Pseudomonas sp. PD9R]